VPATYRGFCLINYKFCLTYQYDNVLVRPGVGGRSDIALLLLRFCNYAVSTSHSVASNGAG